MLPKMFDPKTLYKLCLDCIVFNCGNNIPFGKIRELPNNVLFDFYFRMYEQQRLCFLVMELNEVEVLNRMLKIKYHRPKLLKCFQATLHHGSRIADDVLKNYRKLLAVDKYKPEEVLDIGLRIAGFLIEGGWYNYAINILNIIEEFGNTKEESVSILHKLLDCYHKRLRAESIYCIFKNAESTFNLAMIVICKLKNLNITPNLAGFYANVASLYFVRSEYNQAYEWTKKSLKVLDETLPARAKVDILRQASKTCVVKRQFKQAKLLIDEAIAIVLGLGSSGSQLLYSDVLMDYGYYLLNYDSIQECVKVYQQALAIRKQVFDEDNLHIAIGHGDLAYALYVNEYSSGRFYTAKENAEEALRIMNKFLPKQHLMLAFAMRVKALILEEIALDLRDGNNFRHQEQLLLESEALHKKALKMSYNAFGEHNVQTAKHYGNLGRLYQTMMKYDQAETMHLKAITIKEEIFGPDDYEVGLSIGHLASLYSYHMGRHFDAEKLYKRSVDISLRLFGPSYSGLEYDYRGLIHIYTEINDIDNLLHYTRISREWKRLREEHVFLLEFKKVPLPISAVILQFFNMC